MKFISTFCFLFLLQNLSFSQRDFDYSDRESFESEEQEEKRSFGYQVYLFELLIDPVKGLDDLLANDYPAMNQEGYQYRLRYGFGKKKLSPIIDISYYYRSTANSFNLQNSANIRSFGFGVGHDYNLVNGKHFFLKPMYLINFVWYKINFTENLAGANLNDILNSDYKEFRFKSFQVPIQVGINTGVKFNFKESAIGLLIGGGYNFNYTNTNWKVGQELKISNNIDLSSLYLTLGLISSF